jgi:alkylation response protein AidB-like acyl-CoA dehydrogenase
VTPIPAPDDFREQARAWLSSVATPRANASAVWGTGPDRFAILDTLSHDQELELVGRVSEWERLRYDAGWGALDWPTEWGGRGLPSGYEALYRAEEQRFDTPRRNELVYVTQQLVAPTIRQWGTSGQQQRFIRSLLRTDVLCCQLFSEPGAGSDLASVSTRAERDGDAWVLTGQKVWTSGARVADFGEALCRTEAHGERHAGLTAFIVPLDTPGVTVRPIRQITGGATFNEVFLDEVRVPDDLRLGPIGTGWKVALTTLAAERVTSMRVAFDHADRLLALARHLGCGLSPVARDAVADVWVHERVQSMNVARIVAQLERDRAPGPEGSIGKLAATETMRRISAALGALLGPKLTADSGEWGTYAWAEYVVGIPGLRIAGGSDEIQRNIIAERVLGLPRSPA